MKYLDEEVNKRVKVLSNYKHDLNRILDLIEDIDNTDMTLDEMDELINKVRGLITKSALDTKAEDVHLPSVFGMVGGAHGE